MDKFQYGQKLKLLRPGVHGDLKTAAVFPDRWPTIPKGTIVEFQSEFTNFDGRHASVWWENNERVYDIPIWHFEVVHE